MQEKYFAPMIDKTEIESPALLIDMDKIETNIKMMMDHLNTTKAALRPHFKAHKSPYLALKQIEAGAIGMTCAKVGEAEELFKVGIKDILIANQIVTEKKIRRVAIMARDIDIKVAVDSLENIQLLSKIAVEENVHIGVLVEIDVGLCRCGVKTIPEGVELAKAIVAAPNLDFRGVMGYEGHCNRYHELDIRSREVKISNKHLVDFKHAVEEAGMEVEIVSAGGTMMFDIATENEEITEIQAGAYILMGTKWSSSEGIPFVQAESILATVISVPSDEFVTVDAGLKCYSNEVGPPSVIGYEGMEVVKMSEEHTTFKMHEGAPKLKIGDVIEMAPSNCCTTTNLFDFFHVVRNGKLEMVLPIAARGRFD